MRGDFRRKGKREEREREGEGEREREREGGREGEGKDRERERERERERDWSSQLTLYQNLTLPLQTDFYVVAVVSLGTAA